MGFSSNIKDVIKAIDRKEKGVIPAAVKGMRLGMYDYMQKMTREQMTGRPGLNVRTGTLRRSWFIRTRQEGNDAIVRMATNTKYARIHQYGGTITPKNAKALAIPLQRKAEKASPRDFTDLRLIPRPGGYALLSRVVGDKKKHLENFYVLKKSVTIPKRLHVIEDFRFSGIRMIKQQILKNVNEVLKGQQ